MDLKFDETKFNCKKGDYCTGEAINLSDPSLHARAQEFKRKMGAKMRALSGQELDRVPDANEYHVTRKYDGEFALVFFDGEQLISVNPGGTVRKGLPAFIEAAKLLKKNKVTSAVMAGEIYMRETSSKALPIQQVVRILRNPAAESDLEKLGLAVFDIAEADGETITATKQVFTLLTKWFSKGKFVRPAEHELTSNKDRILKLLNKWVVEEGSEGLVLRNDSAGWFKIKLRHTIDAAVIGFSEGTEGRKGLLHDLLVAVMRDDGTFHELTRVGGGFTEDDRKAIVAEFRRRVVPSDYVAVNNDYVAYEMISPGPVIELSFLDLIPESARGGPVNRMVLEWDGKRYRPLSRLPLVSVISPQYVRIRDDKDADVADVNIRQISDLAVVPAVEKSAREANAEPSQILERTVYTKTMKGNKMVRKLMMWRTNKQDRPEYPAFVVYLTDFSPNRANALEREIRVAETESKARGMFDTLAKQYFVGGWEKVV